MKGKYSFSIKKVFAFLAILAMSAPACNKYLDTKPSKNSGLEISTTDDLNALLNNYSNFYAMPDNIATFGTDDNGLSTDLYKAQPYLFSSSVIQFSLWDTAYLPQTDQGGFFSGPNLWSGEYTKIYNANVVLANVDKVSGSPTDKAALTADAHFIRAYSYWELANTYCLPYTDATKNEPGLPIKTTPDYALVGRSSLAATYQQILSDLTEALKTTVPLVQNGVARHWRANTAAVNGFAARYYLQLNDYTNALKYAQASLALYSTLVDYNSGMYYGVPASVTIDPGTANQQTVTINFPYTHNRNIVDPTDALAWKEFLYYRMVSNSSNWFIPSQDLLNLYDQQNDLRYKYHYVQNYSYTQGMINPSFSYPGYIFFSNGYMPEGPTVAEMILIQAECQARTGDIGGAMVSVNQLYSKRTLTGTAALTAASQDQAITVVLQERRREMPFSRRWFDIRRFNSNDYAGDDVNLSKVFYPYTAYSVSGTQPVKTYSLPKGSRRFASPLPLNDVNSSNGLVLQNTY